VCLTEREGISIATATIHSLGSARRWVPGYIFVADDGGYEAKELLELRLADAVCEAKFLRHCWRWM
jgi:hypothetical protein